MNYILLSVFGLLMASFLNASAYRLSHPKFSKKIYLDRSKCENCKHNLEWYDLMPILSYILTLGKCRYCEERIIIYYPISELFLAISLPLLYFANANVVQYIFLLLLFFLSMYDISTKSVPKTIIDISTVLSLLYFIYQLVLTRDLTNLYSLVPIAVFFVGYILLNRGKEKIGLGDIFVLSSIFLINTLVVANNILKSVVAIGGAYALLIVIIDRKNLQKYIPLLPFITMGYVVGIVLSKILGLL